MNPIDVLGMGADGLASLRPELSERIRAADFLAGGERQFRLVGPTGGEHFIIKNNLDRLVRELRERAATQRCVVLASGDPLFYGIGRSLHGIPNVRFEPAVSSMQFAFARAGLPWHDAALASIHGRDLRLNLLPLLGRPKIGLFTSDGEGPAQVARFFLDRRAGGYEAFVGENLGTAEENFTHWPDLTALAQQRFAPLNFLILYQRSVLLPGQAEERSPAWWRSLVPGAPDHCFERPLTGREIMTRQEVRSILLAKLPPGLRPGDTVWDIGAGLGTVAVEVAVLRPAVEVIAVENDPERLAYLRKNVVKFSAYNVRVIEGTAPEVLAQERQGPQVVFIGGSGRHLAAILDEAERRLEARGRLLANFVTLENLSLTLDRLRQWQWPFEVTEVHVARSDSLAGLTGLKPQRGVFIISADKRAGGCPP